METTAFDCDSVLTDFLSDYLDGNLSRAERQSFEAYLAENEKERVFARKALQGKRAMAKLAGRLKSKSSNTNRSLTEA